MSSCGSSEKRVWKKIKSAVLELLESKQTFCALLVVWMAQGLFAYLVQPPGDDLGEYLTSALGIKHRFENGMFYGDQFTQKYYVQPGFAFFHGLFFKALSVIGLPLNYFTYRLPHMLTVLALIVTSIGLFRLVNKNDNRHSFLLNCNVFLSVLGVTPFIQNCWLVRPEVLGILFVVLGLICYEYWQQQGCRHKILFYFSGLFIGLSTTLHLNFVVITAPVALLIFFKSFRKGNYLEAFVFGGFYSMPLFVVIGWYYVHYPESWQELGFVLLEQKTKYGSSYGGGVARIFKDALMLNECWDTLGKRAYYAYFTIPIGVLLLLFPWTLKKIIGQREVGRCLKIVGWLLVGSILTLVIDRRGMYSYLTNTAFLVVMFWSMFLAEAKKGDRPERQGNGLYVIVLAAICLLASTESLVHGTKYLVSSKKYFYVPRTHEAVMGRVRAGDTLFLTGGKFIAPFFGLFDSQYEGKRDIKVYHVFSKTYLEKNRTRMKEWLYRKLRETPAETTIWGFYKSKMRCDLKNAKCKGYVTVTKFRINLEFTIKDIIYEDSYYVFFRPEVTAIVEAQELEN